MATKKVTKKKAVSKKSKSIKTVQAYRDGFKGGTKKNPLPHVKYLNCAISDISNEKFPEMVQITLGPTRIMNEVGGRRYVSLEKAKIAIDEAQGFALIDKGFTKAQEEMAELGILAVVNEVGPGHAPAAWENKAY